MEVFCILFPSVVNIADAEFDQELGMIEKAPKTSSSLPLDIGILQREYKLYAILSELLRHRPLRIHRQFLDQNGFETWRHLCQLFEPRAKSRSISLSQELMRFPNFEKSRTLWSRYNHLSVSGRNIRKHLVQASAMIS